MSLGGQVSQMELDLAEARSRLAHLEGQVTGIARRMYRRGYYAGRAAVRRGEPHVTNPESRARGELRQLLEGR